MPVPLANPGRSDLIFVLAGAQDRKRYALELFRQALAPVLLLSVSRFEIRRLASLPLSHPLDLLQIAAPIPPPGRHFFVAFDAQSVRASHVPPGPLGTLTEILALRAWLAPRPEIRSLLIISNALHLRRVELCCRSRLSLNLTMQFASPPAGFSTPPSRDSLSAVFLESLKTLSYRALFATRADRLLMRRRLVLE